MGHLVPKKKKAANLSTGTNNNQQQHFVTDLAGRSNLQCADTMYGVLDHQVRDGSYPLHMAIAAGAPVNVIGLIVGEVRGKGILQLVDKHGETPLHFAVAGRSSDEVVDLLCEATETVGLMHVKDKSGNLPVHIAAMKGCSTSVAKRLLLLFPQSIHETNNEMKTPLDLALEHGKCSDEVVRLFEISDHSETSLEFEHHPTE